MPFVASFGPFDPTMWSTRVDKDSKMFSVAFMVAPELNIDLYIEYADVHTLARNILGRVRMEGNTDVERTNTDIKILDRYNVVAAGTPTS